VTFEIHLRYTTPLTPVKDVDEVLREFLTLVGYLPEGEGGDRSIAYRLLRDCFLKTPERPWNAEELATVLKTSKPTIYRHLDKLKAMDLLEEVAEKGEGGPGRKGKGYRIRYGNLSRSWDFVEANAQNALKRYRETVDHLQGLLEASRPVAAAVEPRPAPAKSAGGAPRSSPSRP
jgi:DNA-binding transcriptional ArsR family regulator